MASKIKGLVETITFKNEEKGFYILKVAIKNERESKTVTVNHVNIVKSMTLEFYGDWTNHKVFGKQFKATSCKEIMPETKAGLKAYLSSDFVPIPVRGLPSLRFAILICAASDGNSLQQVHGRARR